MRNPPTQLKHDKTTDRAFVRWKGGKHYFGRYGSKEATRNFAKWLHDACSETPASLPKGKTAVTVGDCIDRYLTHAAGYYTEDGEPSQEFRNIHAAMQSLIDYCDEDFPAADFGPKMLKSIQASLATEMTEPVDPEPGKKATEAKRKYARTTINSRINRIRRCFRWCASEQMIPVAVVEALETVDGLSAGRSTARETDAVKGVPVPIVVSTLPYLSPTVSAMARVQLLCGMRPQDVCRMTCGAVDRSKDIWIYRPDKHKNTHRGKGLIKAVPPAAQEILLKFWREDPNEVIFSTDDSLEHWRSTVRVRPPAVKSKKRNQPVRRPYKTSSYGKSIVYAIARAAKAGVTIPHWQPNQLRHSIATQLRASAGAEAAQLFLGHSKIDTTLIYAEKSASALAEIARQLASPFEDQPPKSEPPKS